MVGECLSFGEDLHCGCCCRVWTATAVLSGVGLVLQIRICLITVDLLLHLYPHSADRMLFDIVVAEGLGVAERGARPVGGLS